jgi:hypothetical protein
VRLSPLGTSATNWPIVPAPDDRWWWMWSSRWNKNWQGKPKYSEKTYHSAILSTRNPESPDLGSNLGSRGGKPPTNGPWASKCNIAWNKLTKNKTSSQFNSYITCIVDEAISGFHKPCYVLVRSVHKTNQDQNKMRFSRWRIVMTQSRWVPTFQMNLVSPPSSSSLSNSTCP